MLSEEEKTKILHQVTDERLQQLQQRQNGMSRQHTEDTIDCCVAKVMRRVNFAVYVAFIAILKSS